MKKLYIAANWKANKTWEEVSAWVKTFLETYQKVADLEIILCPSFIYLSQVKQLINMYKAACVLGAQDISPFPKGAYTGEVTGEQIKEYADFVIIGHSERRGHVGETDDLLEKKVAKAIEYNLTPIFCAQDENTPIPDSVSIIAYEPVSAIGTGNADTPENANKVAKEIKEKKPNAKYLLYGGSVTKENVGSFITQGHIDGVLVGKASLDPLEFCSIIHNAKK